MTRPPSPETLQHLQALHRLAEDLVAGDITPDIMPKWRALAYQVNVLRAIGAHASEDGWIECTKELPKPFLHVNIAVDFEDGEGLAIWSGFIGPAGLWRCPASCVQDGPDSDIAGPVTHWRPMPPGPLVKAKGAVAP